MICDKILLYFYSELEGKELDEFEEHLIHCNECQNKLKELKLLSDLYSQIEKERPSNATVQQILHFTKNRKKFRKTIAVLVGAIAIILLVIFNIKKTDTAWDGSFYTEITIISEKIEKLETEMTYPLEEEIENIKERISEVEKGVM